MGRDALTFPVPVTLLEASPMSVVFDIETGPLDLADLKNLISPFDPLKEVGPRPGEFDPASVKTGNLKDKDKIAAKIAEARERHEADAANYDARCAAAEANYWQSIMDKAALSAVTGQVLAIGYCNGERRVFDCASDDRTESAILSQFWAQFLSFRNNARQMVGFNIQGFDLPFLAQRSWILGVDVPPETFTQAGYLDPTFIDLQRVWAAGSRSPFAGTLDLICRACGLGGKPDGTSGADFARLYADPATRDAAIDYLSNDLDMTFRLAERLGVC